MTSIRFEPPAELITILRGISDKLGPAGLAVPLTDIANAIENEVRGRFSTRDGGKWAPLDPDTIERHGPHSILMLDSDSPSLYDSIRHFVGQYSAGAASSATSILHHHGRQANFATSGGRVNRRDRRTKEEAKAAGQSVKSWGPMPIREFMYISEPLQLRATDILVDYIFQEFD